jgi:hypothetical protein
MLINLSDDRDFFPFAKMGVAIGVYEAKDICFSIEKLLNGSAFKNKSYMKPPNTLITKMMERHCNG